MPNKLSEEYFTDPDVAKALIKLFNKKIGFKKFKLIVEPSAGSGNFYKNIPRSRSYSVKGYDITPRASGVTKQDFFKYKYKGKIKPNDILCIGNPPFGLNSTLAKRFLKKCATFSDHIAFILPISFKSRAFIKSLPDMFQEVWSQTLPDDIFIDAKGYIYEAPIKTMFVYYRNTHKPRIKKAQPKPNKYWVFVNKNDVKEKEYAHIRIVRASGSPGRAFTDFDPKQKTSDYYIELNGTAKRKVNKISNAINAYTKAKKWKFYNVSTFKSIDKSQMTNVINKITTKLQ